MQHRLFLVIVILQLVFSKISIENVQEQEISSRNIREDYRMIAIYEMRSTLELLEISKNSKQKRNTNTSDPPPGEK